MHITGCVSSAGERPRRASCWVRRARMQEETPGCTVEILEGHRRSEGVRGSTIKILQTQPLGTGEEEGRQDTR
jgi:hypothetical protein